MSRIKGPLWMICHQLKNLRAILGSILLFIDGNFTRVIHRIHCLLCVACSRRWRSWSVTSLWTVASVIDILCHWLIFADDWQPSVLTMCWWIVTTAASLSLLTSVNLLCLSCHDITNVCEKYWHASHSWHSLLSGVNSILFTCLQELQTTQILFTNNTEAGESLSKQWKPSECSMYLPECTISLANSANH